ncbi:MAG: tRNA1(Val) (adenine(37)-N6)-methyltransferase [Firmicutes bacterium]|nr:tRNA1(Val) (adenine(37)-N6)-methyltransferase [Dethiobacter sp.]MBS3889167.1 tRNA1(Val) (adenine(37)-N6)-methyltransferase [Bacillota bacterium]MBS4054722.1 tRNA1(Val) (adenine(37)-N6)-methyltransferase [Thermaerobacter sp.]
MNNRPPEFIEPGERIDNLERGGLRIIQNPSFFCFSLDAVLLAHFAPVQNYDRVMDLCTGSGIIPLLLSTRAKGLKQVGLELCAETAERAGRSMRLNRLEESIEVVNGDVRQVRQLFPTQRFNLVTVNPPYLPLGQGETSGKDARSMARHEVTLTLAEVVRAAAYLLPTGGRLAMVHRACRLADILITLRENRLEPKLLRFVHTKVQAPSSLVLLEAVRDAKPLLKVGVPIYIHKADGTYTCELQELYAGGELR